MVQICRQLAFISDPGHGWLRVPLVDIAALGIESEVSSCSFIDGDFAYLEEDCDCALYLAARTAQGLPKPEIQMSYLAHFDRSRPCFGEAQFGAEFWDKLRR